MALDKWGATISNAVSDAAARQAAVREAEAALQIAREIPASVFVVHLGTPTVQGGENNRAAAQRSVEEICRLAEPIGIRVAVEVIPNPLSDASSLVALLERDLEAQTAGICLDLGHAFLLGDVADAVETVAEHLITTHVHDNGGKKDDHLVPSLSAAPSTRVDTKHLMRRTINSHSQFPEVHPRLRYQSHCYAAF